MNKRIISILKSQIRGSRYRRRNRGFTLIELLVALVISSIIISSLLGFMVTILTSDRQELAKSAMEQDLQAAMNYISRDLRQAVYIYDTDGLTNTDTSPPGTSTDTSPGIRDQIPPFNGNGVAGCNNEQTCRPVLVFWKREKREQVLPIPEPTSPTNLPTCPPPAGQANPRCDDTYVYSLVAYYLIANDNANNTWAGTARIARFQIQDGIKNPLTNAYFDDDRRRPDDGFRMFSLQTGSGSSVSDRLKRWKKATQPLVSGRPTTYSQPANVLLDFVDHTRDNAELPRPKLNNHPNTIAEGQDFCQTLLPTNYQPVTDPATGTTVTYRAQLLPAFHEPNFPNELKTGSFYACVDSRSTQAYIFIRGNALARFNPINRSLFSARQAQYFPTISGRVQGRGLLGNQLQSLIELKASPTSKRFL